ncbi:MAG: BPSS1780 family membrane protein [Pseudomonadota bacterium]
MRLHIVPPRTGLTWARSGIRAFWRQPLALTGLFCPFAGLQILAAVLPLPLSALLLVLVPAVTLGLMAATREVVAGHPARPHMLLAGFRAGPAYARPLLLLGLFYAIGVLVVMAIAMGISALVDGGQPATPYVAGGDVTKLLTSDLGGRATAALLYLFLSMLFWHAPALVFWYRVSPPKSLFFSVVACIRNMGAFTLYGLAWAGIFVAGSLAAAFVVTLILLTGLLGGPTSPAAIVIAGGLMSGSALVLAAMFFTSLYFTFIDCFVQPPHASTTATILEDADEPPPAAGPH